MREPRECTRIGLVGVALSMTLGVSACKEAKGPTLTRRAVVVVMDGVRAEESFAAGENPLTHEPMENFFPKVRSMFPRGTLLVRATQSAVTKTQPAHATLLTGTHLPFGHFPHNGGDGGSYVLEAPSLFHSLLEANPEARGLIVSNTSQVQPVTRSLYPGASGVLEWDRVNSGDDGLVLRRVRQAIKDNDYQLILANLHEADRAGHDSQVPEDYTEVAKLQDEPIYQLWQEIQHTPGYADQTVMVVLADHGRHSPGVADGFEDHGDSCAGCRAVPMFWIGPDIPEGEVLTDGRWDLVDVAPTLAAWLGVKLPLADGLPITELVSAPSRSGRTERTTRAWVELLDQPSHRRTVMIDGAPRSGAESIDARGPVAGQGSGSDVWCWRELGGVGGAPGQWFGQCWSVEQGYLDFPAAEVSPYLRAAVASEALGFTIFFEDNPYGLAWNDPQPLPLQVARWRSGAWSVPVTVSTTHFPQWSTICEIEENRWLLAWTGSPDGPTARDHRDLHLRRLDWPEDGEPQLTEIPAAESDARQERPAVWSRDGEVRVAWIDEQPGEVKILATTSSVADLGTATPTPVSGDSVIPIVQPVFSPDGALAWAELLDGEAWACREERDGTRSRVLLDAAYVESLAFDEGWVYMVQGKGGVWEERRPW